MGTLTSTLANSRVSSDGSLTRVDTIVAFGTSYNNTGSNNTTGETLTAASVGLSRIKSVVFNQDEGTGFGFSVLYSASGAETIEPSAVRVKVFASAGGAGITGSTSGGTPAGTVTAPTIQAEINSSILVNAGTGVGAAVANTPIGGVDFIFIEAGGVTGPAIIVPVGQVANTREVSINYTTGVTQFLVADAVTLARINYQRAATTVPVFAGNALAGHTHTIAAGGGGEVANGTNLNAAGLSAVQVTIYGY